MSAICKTPFTIEWLCEKLEKYVGKSLKLKTFTAKRIGQEEGFLSAVVLVNFEWDSGENGAPKSVVFKTPEVSGAGDELSVNLAAWLPSGHHNEAAVYEMFKHDPSLALPTIYFTQLVEDNRPGIIVMEYLDGTIADGIQGLNLNQILQVTEALARFHAASFGLKNWKDKFVENRSGWEKILAGWAKYPETQMRAVDPAFCDRVLSKVAKWFDPSKVYDLMTRSQEKIGLPTVPVHGDLWNPNFFWESKDGKASDQLMAIIDWQLAHPGNLAEDIGCMLASSVDPELRRKETDRILEFYYETLCKLTGNALTFSLSQLKEGYKVALHMGMLLMMFSVPFWLQHSCMKGENRKANLAIILDRTEQIVSDVLG